MEPTLILDTNVLVAALRSSAGASHALVRLVGQGRFTLGVTAALVLEYEAVLKRPGLIPLPAGDVDALLDYFCRVGLRRTVPFRLRPVAADPGDDLVLEAAVSTGSIWIVTFNASDMAEGASRYGIELLSPGRTLGRLGEAR